ncbi:Leucine-rich repeat 3 [Sesbania bispinosa]|nr:Leucine-rich repeat 3 [Sesbania bispinosa]
MYKLRLLNFYMPSSDKRSNVHISRGLESMPDELSYLRWDCFPLTSLPPSFCAEKLVELDLKHSLIERLWDGKQDLVNLKSLYLCGSKHLIELPDFSMASKLEEVHLDDCTKDTAIEELPSSVGQLKDFSSICLDHCKRLQNLPNTFYESGLDCSIQLLDCPKPKKLRPTLDTLIVHYHSLSGQLRLRSLPELSFLLQDLNASNCVSLESVSNLGITMLQDSFGRLKKSSLLRQVQEEEKMSLRNRGYLGRFEFHNCIKLDQIACKTVMVEALIRIQLAAYLSSMIDECHDPYCQTDEVPKNFDPDDLVYISRPVYIVLPGNEVPNWFIHKRRDSSITLELFAPWHCCCNYLGLAFCLVLGPSHSNRKKNQHIGFVAECRYYFEGKYAGTCMIMSSCNDAESDQVWLWFDKLLGMTEKTDRFSLYGGEVSFEFFVRPCSSGLVVKQCGIRPLYAPHDIMQSSNELEGKRPYAEFEYYKDQRNYELLRLYAHPPGGLGFPSEKQSISGYHDGHRGKSFPSTYCANDVDEITLQHVHWSNVAEVRVYFVVAGCHHQRDESMSRALRYLAQLLLDDYCNFGKLLDNINVFSSLRSLQLNGWNVESLPASIEHLSRLEFLSLFDCKRLRSLPKLPPSILDLYASQCTSLETVELAKEDKVRVQVHGDSPNIIKGMAYENVSRIQLTDPGGRVTKWIMRRLAEDSMAIFYVAPYTESWNVMCESDFIQSLDQRIWGMFPVKPRGIGTRKLELGWEAPIIALGRVPRNISDVDLLPLGKLAVLCIILASRQED